MSGKFNIRVYGIWLKNDQILISNENIDGFEMVKLPGGGLEFGEGTKDCLIREFKEELDVKIEVKKLLHTTDTFIESAFKKNEQIIACHYLVDSSDLIREYAITQSTKVGRQNKISFEWRDLTKALFQEFTFEMDKIALEKLF